MRKLIVFIIGVILTIRIFADTGTYDILDYQIKITPLSDGTVEMVYYQKWKVTGGHIPWMTVGLANNNYDILGSGGAVVEIGPADGFTGVRIDLDEDYQPEETFEVTFSIKQRNLLWAEDTLYYQMEFTPGWYDRAFINHLLITVRFFAPLDSVQPKPEPTYIGEETMNWEWKELGKGQRVEIAFTIPAYYYPDVNEENLKSSGTSGVVILFVVLGIIAVIIILVLVVSAIDGSGGYSGGSLYYGSSSGSSGGGISSGGGGGFGGRSSSCACACVSCACACACAGGGGAGCSRKQTHECLICKKIKNEKKSFFIRLLVFLSLW